MLQPKVTEIINEYLNENTENYNEMRNNLSQYKNIFQYVYCNIFPEIYCSTEQPGFDLKSSFHIMLKTYKDKKMGMLAKSLKVMREYIMKYHSVIKNQSKEMILMRLRKKKLKSALKKEK